MMKQTDFCRLIVNTDVSFAIILIRSQKCDKQEDIFLQMPHLVIDFSQWHFFVIVPAVTDVQAPTCG